MSLRYDVHRPSAIEPADYEFVGQEAIKCEGIGDAEFIMAERERIRTHMKKTGGTYSAHAHGGNCHICGSPNAIYTVLFYHAKSNSYVRAGGDCAEKLDFDDGGAFRRAIADAREAQAGKAKARAVLSDRGLERAYAIYEAKGEKFEEATVRDIVARLVRYGSISDKAFAYVAALLERVDTREEREAARKVEHDAADPLPPTGERIEVVGTILARKSREFGPDKLLIKADAGWKVWGNVSSALCEFKHGDKVAFFARVEPSKEDPKFGFYSRPSKVRLVA